MKNFKTKFLKQCVCVMLTVFMLCGLCITPTKEVSAAGNPITMSSCKLNTSGSALTIKAKVKQKTKAMGNKLYVFALDAYKSEKGTISGTPLATVATKKGKISFSVKYKTSMLYKKFVVAYKKGKKYQIASDAMYITNPEKLASYTGTGVKTTSKKGLQPDFGDTASSTELRTQHVVLNWSIEEILNSNCGRPDKYKYGGKTYTFDLDRVEYLQTQVRDYINNGSKVYVILLLDKGAKGQAGKMSYGGGQTFSSIKTTSSTACKTWEAFMTYMAEKFGTEKYLVSGWILGNEVDSPYNWNYAGGKNLSSYMEDYARAYRIAYNAAKSVSSNSKVYISLDYNWNLDTDGGGTNYFTTKSTLDTFYSKLKATGKININIAYHAYPQGLLSANFWDDFEATNSTSSKIITMKNISVLTKYVKNKFGKDATIMLSEQAFNSTEGENLQAAAYAYAYYISEGNDMIESFIYARDKEPASDVAQGFYWGLRDVNGNKRKIWNVFRCIDSKESLKKTKSLVAYTDLKSWTDIPGIKSGTFDKQRSINKTWPLVQATSLYVTLDDGYYAADTKFVYDAMSHKPKVTVCRNYTGEKVPTKNYKVKYLTDCRNVGVHKIQIKLKGDYQGTIIKTFEIVPQNPKITSLEAESNAVAVNWTIPQASRSQITGYKIEYTAHTNAFYGASEDEIVTVKVKNNEATEKKIKKLAPNTTYYFRIYAYKTEIVDGKKVDVICDWDGEHQVVTTLVEE